MDGLLEKIEEEQASNNSDNHLEWFWEFLTNSLIKFLFSFIKTNNLDFFIQ